MQRRNIILALDSAAMGGIETHVLTLARTLMQRGHLVQVCLFGRYTDHPLYQRLDEMDVDYTFVHNASGFWTFLRTMQKDVCLHTHGYKAGIYGRIMAKCLGIKATSTFHSGDMGRGKLWFYCMLDQYTASLAPAIAVSQEIGSRLGSKAQLIPNFVDVPEQLPPCTLRQNGPNVAFVGRLSEEKGPDLFCQLALSCKETPLNFKMYGDGPMAGELREQYSSDVDFKGAVVMDRHWHEVAVLCISSRFEGLPLVALEAMSRGIPVVTFNIGGLAELISHPKLGYLVKPGQVEGLKAALLQWFELDSQSREAMRLSVYERIRHGFSAQALVPQIEAVYG